MEPDKAAAYDRNIVAAEVAMRNAAALGDTDAYNRALFVLGWATEGRDRLTATTTETTGEQRIAPRKGMSV